MVTKNRKTYLSWKVAEHRRKIKLRAIEYKGGACCKCGYNKYPEALEFHHVDPKEKDLRIGSGTPLKWETIVRELDKTILVCSNCHAEIHYAWDEVNRVEREARVRALVPARANKSNLR